MTGRRLYDHYCDATVQEFHANRGGYQSATTPLPAWPSLSNASRSRWNALARKLNPPKRRTSR